MIVWLSMCLAAFAGPGFDEVGGRNSVPGFGPDAEDASVTEAQIQRVLQRESELLEAVRRYDPTVHQQLLRLRDNDRKAYVAAMVRVARNVERARQDPTVMKRVMAIRAKSREVESLVRGFSRLSAPEQRERRKQITKLAGELMDLKQQDRRARMRQMQERLDALRSDIEQRDRDRARIVEQFVDQLLEEPVEL
ncbi:MAG: hypothetical protein KTR31_05560 [Myxococcales bacterium]|nr:hypothetical protein [Myxococcales bacterium]